MPQGASGADGRAQQSEQRKDRRGAPREWFRPSAPVEVKRLASVGLGGLPQIPLCDCRGGEDGARMPSAARGAHVQRKAPHRAESERMQA
jgi:hypothetical protein